MFSLRPLAILFHFFLLVLVSNILCARAQSNITVEDSDANIEFGGEWEMKLEPTDRGGSHKVSWGTENTYVLFKFYGTAYYLMSAKWPYDVSCVVILDGGPAVRVDMMDHASPYDETEKGGPTIASHVVAFMTGLDPDIEHEIRIEPFPGAPRTVFDAIVYTSLPSESPSASTSIEAKLRPSDTPAPASAMPITIGISTGVTLCTLLVVLLLYRCRRRRQNKQDKSKLSCMNSPDIFSPSHRTRIKLDDLEAPLPSPSWYNLPNGPGAAHQHQPSLDSMYTSLSNPMNHLPMPLTAEPASYHIQNQPQNQPAIPFATLSRPNARSVSIPLFPPPPPPSTPAAIELNYLFDTKSTDYEERPPAYVSWGSKMPRQSTAPRYSTDHQSDPPVPKRSSIGKPPVLTLSHERRREDRGSTFSDLMSSSVGSSKLAAIRPAVW